MAKSYGKRPLWQWILIYIIIGAIVYGAIYFLFLRPKGSEGGYIYSSDEPSTSTEVQYTY